MKLHDAMRKAVREYGVRVISEKQLLFILSDLRAFEEYPAVKLVLEAIVSGDTGKELVRLFLEEDRDWFLSYAGNLRKSLSVKNHFREDLADYAADSLLYGLGLRESVTEPTDHGFDPAEHGRSAGNQDTGGRKELREKEEKARTEEKNSGGAKECGAGVTRSEHSGQKTPVVQGSRAEAAWSGSAATRNDVAKFSSKAMKWLIAACLLAIIAGFSLGRLTHQKDTDSIPAAVRQLPGQYEYQQGEEYYYGRRDYAEALAWYRKAADKGSPEAEYMIGWMYEYGLGVGPDSSMALIWYRRAAAHGNEDALKGIERLQKQVPAKRGDNGARKTQGSAAAGDDPGAVSMFGRKVYLRGEFDDCPWDRLSDRCLIQAPEGARGRAHGDRSSGHCGQAC